MVLLVSLAAVNTLLVCILKMMSVLFCHVHLWLYILGEYMCVLLVLVLWCPVYSSTLVCDLECHNIFLLLLYPSCRRRCCVGVVYSGISTHTAFLSHSTSQTLSCGFHFCHRDSTASLGVSPDPPVLLLLMPSLRTRVISTLFLACFLNIIFVVYLFQNSTFFYINLKLQVSSTE